MENCMYDWFKCKQLQFRGLAIVNGSNSVINEIRTYLDAQLIMLAHFSTSAFP